MNILVPVDFNHTNEASVALIHKLFQKEHASIHLLHVVDTSPVAAFPDTISFSQQLEEQMLASAQRRLEAFRSKLAYHNTTFVNAVVSGFVIDGILSYCKEKAIDMIAIPTHGRKGLEHFLMGSVTEKLVRLSPVPVLTFKNS